MGFVDKLSSKMQGRGFFYFEPSGVTTIVSQDQRNKKIGGTARGCRITGPALDTPFPLMEPWLH